MPVCKIQSHVQKKIKSNNNEQDKIYNDKKKEKTTGRVEEVPKYVTRFIEKDPRGRIVTPHPDGHCVSRVIGKIWNLHPGQVVQYLAKKCQKTLDQELTTQQERNVEWYEKTANRPIEWETMQTRRMGWVIRNTYLGDKHQNNNGGNKRR